MFWVYDSIFKTNLLMSLLAIRLPLTNFEYPRLAFKTDICRKGFCKRNQGLEFFFLQE